MIMEVIENQIMANDPPEAAATLERLISEGYTEDDARRYIGRAVCVEIWDTLKNEKKFSLARYIQNLKGLPLEPRA